ncbi:MAG: ATP-dependent DNA ligase [Candidatus Rokuibacteriota bacterium]|nr:MAG: ATP-dependent DNA ligase [Candidatus Rokubacteria bacterium]
MIFGMIELSRLADLCRRLRTSPGRLDKLALLADYLRALPADAVATAVAFLTGRAFPQSDPRVLGVRWLPSVDDAAAGAGPPLSLADVAAAFADIAEASGAGSRRTRAELLRALAKRASADERETIQRIMVGELRTGVSDGLVLEAVARAFGAPLESTRRAALRLGDLSAVAALAARGGVAALTSASVRPGVPLLPMLAQIGEDFDEVLEAHGGTSALEYKYDGARIQLHRDGERVSIWTRRLSDVTRSLPDVVETARRELVAAPFILDGEVLALDGAGRPLPFQELMRRFRRVHEVERLVREMPLTLYFFDCLMADGRSLLDEPYARRWEALTAITGGRYLAERALVTAAEAAREFRARALAAGHEGVVAKDLRSSYEPGGRGKRWFKLKVAETVDCVIIAVDRGSGRRSQWLSNYHLAVRDADTYADVGKTFKGLTDRQFVEMTERLWALAVSDDGYTVRVRPEVVVEVAYNEIQKSPTYRSGMALRFARITRIRDDKAPGQATTLEELRLLYERQFATKGRSV